MKKHTKIYLDAFGYSGQDFIPCEISDLRAVDIHHIESRGMGGSKNADRIENLMALTRENHLTYGDKPAYMAEMFTIHKIRLQASGVKFDANYIDEKIKHYETLNILNRAIAV